MEASVFRILEHFSSLTTLDLFDFPLSPAIIHSIRSLKGLKTLSIRSPEDSDSSSDDLLSEIKDLDSFYMPAVTTLSLVNIGDKAHLTGHLIKVLESSLVNLTITGTDYGDMYADDDVISSLLLANPSYIKLLSLKHLTIDFLKFKASSLRTLIQNCEALESLYIECRGTRGFLPLFYVIDMISHACGPAHRGSDEALVRFERWQEDPENEDPGSFFEEDEECASVLSSFSAVFSSAGNDKVLGHLELAFATGDEDLKTINNNLNLLQLSKTLSSGGIAFIFSSLKKLVLTMTDEITFDSASEEEKKVYFI